MFRRLTASPLTTLLALALGLTLGLAGTALASRPSQPSSNQKLTKGQVKKLVNKQIAKAAPTLSVAHAGSADTATTANTANTANTATTAANATKVGGLLPSDLVRATTATAGSLANPCGTGAVLDNFASTTYTDVVSKSVTVPVNGLLVILSNVEAGADNNPVPPAGATSNWEARVTVDGTPMGGVSDEGTDSDVIAFCHDAGTGTVTTAVPVTAGSHVVKAQIHLLGGNLPLYVGYGSVTTLFVPFGNAGTQGVVGRTQSPGAAATN
jgi:hypothetical protein